MKTRLLFVVLLGIMAIAPAHAASTVTVTDEPELSTNFGDATVGTIVFGGNITICE